MSFVWIFLGLGIIEHIISCNQKYKLDSYIHKIDRNIFLLISIIIWCVIKAEGA